MSKNKYYIKVTTFANTTKLGDIVAKQVWATYNKSVVTSGREVDRITEFIINAQNEAIKENAKLKRMNVKYFTGKDYFYISLEAANCDTERMAFSLFGELIEHEYCEKEGEL